LQQEVAPSQQSLTIQGQTWLVSPGGSNSIEQTGFIKPLATTHNNATKARASTTPAGEDPH
jgi:hypothetical protein